MKEATIVPKNKPQGLLLAMMDMAEEDEEEFSRWSDAEHVPQRLDGCPGFLSYRRFVAVKGKPKFLLLYELESPEALESPEYKGLTGKDRPNMTPAERERSDRIHAKWSNFVRNVYVEVPTPHSPTLPTPRSPLVERRSRKSAAAAPTR